MAKFRVLKAFNGKTEDKHFKAGEVVDLTVKRAKEIEDKIDKSKCFKGTGPYLERVDVPTPDAEDQERDTMAFNFEEIKAYYEELPEQDITKDIPEEELKGYLFDAYEDINSRYPRLKISPRMIIKQMEFKIESEQFGVGVMQRLGIKSQKINDASVELKHGAISPYVQDLISIELGHGMGRIGRLV